MAYRENESMNNEIMNPKLRDFRNFLYIVWQHLSLPEPTEIQYDIAKFLQYGGDKICIEAFRGIGKSYITSAFVCWKLLMDPQEKILVVSASKERADNFSTFTKRLIEELPLLQHLKPRAEQRDSKISFDVGPARAAHAPSVKSVGVTGQITGSRANTIIADDVEVPGNSETQMMRDKLDTRTQEFSAVLSPGGRIVYLGTPQCEDSLYNKLPSRGYTVQIWPVKYPTEKMVEKYEGKLAQYILDRYEGNEGKPTEPSRFGEFTLMEKEAEYAKSGFALQFMLDTSLSDAERYPLKLSDLIVTDLDPEVAPTVLSWTNAPEKAYNDLPVVGMAGDRYYRPIFVGEEYHSYEGSVMFIDPSGRGKDKVGYAIVKHLNGRLFVLDAGGLRGGYNDATLVKLCEKAKYYKVNRILYESNFGDGMFGKLLTPHMVRIYPCTIEEVRHSKQKELRIIDTLEPVMNQHRLVVDRQVILNDFHDENDQNHRLFYQMTRITKDRGALLHDDPLDALAGAVNYWVESMARDTQRGAYDLENRRREEQVNKFLKVSEGRFVGDPHKKTSKKGWIKRR